MASQLELTRPHSSGGHESVFSELKKTAKRGKRVHGDSPVVKPARALPETELISGDLAEISASLLGNIQMLNGAGVFTDTFTPKTAEKSR